jgi:hypothetical protein
MKQAAAEFSRRKLQCSNTRFLLLEASNPD